MPDRLLAVDDTFTLPAAVKVADTNLPARLGATELNATYASKATVDAIPATYATKAELPNKFVLSTDANAPLTDGQILFVIEPSWTPNNLANVKMWFDAQQQTAANGALLAQLNDYSGQARHAAQAVDANKPVFSTSGINGKSAFVLGGTKRASVPTFTAISGPITIISVVTATAPTATAEYVVDSTGGTALFRSATTGALGSVRGSVLAGSAVSTAPHVLIAEFGVGTNNSKLIKDGATDATGTTTDTIDMTSLTIGARLDLTRFWQGNIGELIVVNGILTAQEKTNLAAYTAAKWGI